MNAFQPAPPEHSMSGIANTQSPYGAVFFNSHRTEGDNWYAEMRKQENINLSFSDFGSVLSDY
tara:strand:- start:203 stop:391 length:189 start_codon:yes stop_codon:yes gene_type:complete